MDSVSQFLLGAAVSTAVMGHKAPVWQAVLVGGVAGTLPDLDVLIDHGDALRNMTLHRAASHSLLYLSLLAPLLAWPLHRAQPAGAGYRRWWLAVWLALITHPLLDLMTVYGTQLALPFTVRPWAIGSMFIIDPLYTLPLLLGTVMALWRRGDRGRWWNALGLSLSTLYILWSVAAQGWVTERAEASLTRQGIRWERLLVTPTALNTLVWRVVALDGDSYREGYFSLLSPERPLATRRWPRDAALAAQLRQHPDVQRLASFSQGFWQVKAVNDEAWLMDLRMGEAPDYTFTFNLGPPNRTESGTPVQRVPVARPGLAAIGQRFWQRL
ncbi:metal-dependent hydrolase [Pantoea sp. 1.19]|uniref:metal-dependent hydrolase n=1 Tax=Pantoea sp. 1.19 TaxID=1925589 RepID=UPI000948BCE0|nr:metal-dependent hydrolase [Pantoea sp. 1.19]